MYVCCMYGMYGMDGSMHGCIDGGRDEFLCYLFVCICIYVCMYVMDVCD